VKSNQKLEKLFVMPLCQ